jgi:carbon storage regulator
MLVLTRRVGEQIVIADDIRITVAAISGNKVRLGISAPDGIRVDRQEVHERRLRAEDHAGLLPCQLLPIHTPDSLSHELEAS